jgi:hypothetical protein
MIQPTAAPDFLGLRRRGGIDRFILRTNGRCLACKQAEPDDELFLEIRVHHWPLVSIQAALHAIAPESVHGHACLDGVMILALADGLVEGLFS